VDDIAEMGDIAEKISTELRNQYVIGYRPKDLTRDGKWRKVKVKVNPPPGLPPLTSMLAPATMRLCNNAVLAVLLAGAALFAAAQQSPAQAAGPAQARPRLHRSPWTATRCARRMPSAAPPDRPLRKEGEGYVLHTDVEEVVLNCTVLDGNRLVRT
jgi:hypothetical protein